MPRHRLLSASFPRNPLIWPVIRRKMETLSGSQIRTFQLKKYGMQRILLTKARIYLFFFSFENIHFSYRNSVNISFVFLMAHLIKIDVFIKISDLKVKECFISLVRFTVIMARKFRDPSWCPLKIKDVRLIEVRLMQVSWARELHSGQWFCTRTNNNN